MNKTYEMPLKVMHLKATRYPFLIEALRGFR